jgi:hypothetical protein
MNDTQRYRTNAAECLSAAERRESPYRSFAFTIAAYWLSLARQQEAMSELLGVGGDAAMPAASPALAQPARHANDRIRLQWGCHVR